MGEPTRSGTPIPPTAAEKSATLTTTLVPAMGKALGYDFGEVQIKKGGCYPMFSGNIEEEQHALRRGLLDVLLGKRLIPVGVFEYKFPPIPLPPFEHEEASTADEPPMK